jgi:hypothetical protein
MYTFIGFLQKTTENFFRKANCLSPVLILHLAQDGIKQKRSGDNDSLKIIVNVGTKLELHQVL